MRLNLMTKYIPDDSLEFTKRLPNNKISINTATQLFWESMKPKLDLDTLPPTREASKQHSLRVHLQVSLITEVVKYCYINIFNYLLLLQIQQWIGNPLPRRYSIGLGQRRRWNPKAGDNQWSSGTWLHSQYHIWPMHDWVWVAMRLPESRNCLLQCLRCMLRLMH